MEVFYGRPADVGNRLDKEIRCYDMLDKLKIEYTRVDHEAAETMEACEAIDKALDVSMCKNLLMPADKPFKTKELSSQINSARLSFAGPEDMERLLDITPGSVSVLGLMNDKDDEVTLLIDKDLLKDEYIGCHPCINTSSLKIRSKDILEKFLHHLKIRPEYVNLVGKD